MQRNNVINEDNVLNEDNVMNKNIKYAKISNLREIYSQKSYTRITLCLDIIKKLTQGPFAGYHELGIIKHKIDLYDEMTILPSENMEIICDNPEIPTNNENLCWKVVDILKKTYDIDKNVKIILKKNIPAKGGLAGGSANAATTLEILNKMWELNLNDEDLITIGKKVGMDVPFYFFGDLAYDTESTGILEPIKSNINLDFIIALPKIGVSTKEAYKHIDYTLIGRDITKTNKMKEVLEKNNDILSEDNDDLVSKKKINLLHEIAYNMHNDFEYSVFKSYPELSVIKKEMIKLGCLNACLSGSGSSIIGLVENKKKAKSIRKKILEDKNSSNQKYDCIIASSKPSRIF